MAIKKFADYDKTQTYREREQLPRGGYVLTILGARVQENQYGQSVKIAFDIAEGEYKGFFQRQYDADTREDKKWPGTFLLPVPDDDGSERDGWTKRRFRTFTDALEESNDGYRFDWDESKFKGLLVGMVFNYRQYEINDRVGFAPNPARPVPAQQIREGRFKIPEDKLLKGHAPVTQGFTQVEEEIPF